MKTFLCLIVEAETGRELKEYELDARDEFFAKNDALVRFGADRQFLPEEDRTCKYKVEVCEI